MGTDPDVGAEPILLAESIMDVPLETKVEMGREVDVVIVEPVIVADVVFDFPIRTNDMVYLFISFVFVYLHYLNY